MFAGEHHTPSGFSIRADNAVCKQGPALLTGALEKKCPYTTGRSYKTHEVVAGGTSKCAVKSVIYLELGNSPGTKSDI